MSSDDKDDDDDDVDKNDYDDDDYNDDDNDDQVSVRASHQLCRAYGHQLCVQVNIQPYSGL